MKKNVVIILCFDLLEFHKMYQTRPNQVWPARFNTGLIVQHF